MFKHTGGLITVRVLPGLKKIYLPVCNGDLPWVSIFVGKRILTFLQNEVPIKTRTEKDRRRRNIYLFIYF